MKAIAPYSLWLGHAGDGRDFRAILEQGIEAVVQLAADEPELQLPRDLIYCRFPLVDGPGNNAVLLSLAVTTVAGLLEKRVPTLVCCSAGLSRAPAIAAAALSVIYQDDADACLTRLAEQLALDVQPLLWHEIKSMLAADRI